MTWKCNTITQCRPTHGSLRNRHRTLMATLHQRAIKVKQPALMIAYLETTLKVYTTKQEPRTKPSQNNGGICRCGLYNVYLTSVHRLILIYL